MATILNNPGDGNNNATGWIVAIVAIGILVLLTLFLFPNLFAGTRTTTETTTTETPDTRDTSSNPMAPAPVINNTTLNSTTTINNSTTTVED